MMTIFRIGGSIATWVLLWLISQGFGNENFHMTISFLNIYCVPLVGIIVSIISVVNPAIFDMGVAKYAKANLYERLFPLLVVGLLLYMSTWFTPTVIIALVNSYYLGVAISYIFKVIGTQMGW